MMEKRNDIVKAIICLLPALVVIAIFSFYPIINAFVLSFKEGFTIIVTDPETGRGVEAFVSLTFNNYTRVLNDPLFWRALQNTTIMVFISVPLTILISLGIAVALNNIKKLQGFFQTIFFLPYVTNSIALGMVFAVMFNKDYGLINRLFDLTVDWKGKDSTYWSCMFVLIVYSIWNGLAFKILVFLSALQGVDKQYYQAAQIDNTPRWRVFSKITVPMISPMILYITITSFIGAFKAYSSVISLFNGEFGPASDNNMLITVVGYIYMQLEKDTNYWSVAAAGSIILLIIILILTGIQMWISKKKVVY